MKKNLLIILLLIFLTACSTSGNTISYVKAKELIINNNAYLIDVRTQEEFNQKHIDGAMLMPLDTIDNILVTIEDKDHPIIVYCQSGVRSKEAAKRLKENGYTQVYDLGAMSNWKD